MTAPIAPIVISSLRKFGDLIAASDLLPRKQDVPRELWEDERGRLRVWASIIGAHQTGQFSLDYRLRDASHIRDQTVRLLKSLQQTLGDLSEVFGESPIEGNRYILRPRENSARNKSHKSIIWTIPTLIRVYLGLLTLRHASALADA
jgi:hypothetical protein